MSRTRHALESTLRRIDGRGYAAYRDLRGAWDLSRFRLELDHVQADPFAPPSRLRIQIGPDVTGLPDDLRTPDTRSTAIGCALARSFSERIRSHAPSPGRGTSGEIGIEAPGQETIPNTAVLVRPDGAIEVRLTLRLPARGRRVLGAEAARLLLEVVPRLVGETFFAESLDLTSLRNHADVNEDADWLRARLPEMGLVAFVADGSILPRRTGADPRPLQGPAAVAFRSPDTLRIPVDLPHAGRVHGMGVPQGITLIVGGGYHGKSTLLNALQHGVYNHAPGDGRERVITDATAVKIRAEDGRSVRGVDISAFIGNLPGAGDTKSFSTDDASGSTSQAAAIMEALEAGSRLLLVDEDTAATNFMIRDRRMQALIPDHEEPITPFVDRVRSLREERGVSTVLVLGGSGDYLDVADRVIAMKTFRPCDVTDRARDVALALPTGRVPHGGPLPGSSRSRVPLAGSPGDVGGREAKVRTRGRRGLFLGHENVDLGAVEQLVWEAQTRALGKALIVARELIDGHRSVPAILDAVDRMIAEGGLDRLDPRRPGDLALFRRFELSAALNRLRSLIIP